jgi:hypothetical protein
MRPQCALPEKTGTGVATPELTGELVAA